MVTRTTGGPAGAVRARQEDAAHPAESGRGITGPEAGRPSAENRVHRALRAALSAEYRLYPNVRWISRASDDAPARDGETDLLIAHPEHGLLIVETKGGRIARDSQGRWFSGAHQLKPPPFEQAETSKHEPWSLEGLTTPRQRPPATQTLDDTW